MRLLCLFDRQVHFTIPRIADLLHSTTYCIVCHSSFPIFTSQLPRYLRTQYFSPAATHPLPGCSECSRRRPKSNYEICQFRRMASGVAVALRSARIVGNWGAFSFIIILTAYLSLDTSFILAPVKFRKPKRVSFSAGSGRFGK